MLVRGVLNVVVRFFVVFVVSNEWCVFLFLIWKILEIICLMVLFICIVGFLWLSIIFEFNVFMLLKNFMGNICY